ncbi:uncharacterized protein LOC135138902 [Zophobas morio]|uniref:uncharacterized protein LOC135138902 n=1 Tax=Zophobas morio TaxID=2755281 RepID=UPI003082D8CE
MERFLCSLVVLVTCSSALKLPPSFQQCDRRTSDFHDCLSNAVKDAIQQLKEPLPEYGLPKLEPFEAPKEAIVEYGDETTGIRQKYSNMKIGGYTKIENTSASCSRGKIFDLNITFTELHFESDYEAHGRFILFPIDVSTTVTMLIARPTFRIHFDLEDYKKIGLRHFRVTDGTLDIDAEKMTFDYKNVFKEESLTKKFNDGMDENWQNILDYLLTAFPKFWVSLYIRIFNNLLEKVPVSELVGGF